MPNRRIVVASGTAILIGIVAAVRSVVIWYTRAGSGLKGIATTAGVMTAAAVLSVTFSDKPSSLAVYGNAIVKLLRAKDTTAARAQIEEVSKRLDALPRPAHDSGSASRTAAKLIAVDIDRASGKITLPQWIDAYRQILQQDSGAGVDACLTITGGGTYPDDGIRQLLRANVLPSQPRGRFATWMARDRSLYNSLPVSEMCGFFSDLLAASYDTDSAGDVLELYIAELRKRHDDAVADAVLRDMSRFFPNYALGVSAASLSIPVRGDSKRADAIAMLCDARFGRKLDESFRREYAATLLDLRQFEHALQVIDDGKLDFHDEESLAAGIALRVESVSGAQHPSGQVIPFDPSAAGTGLFVSTRLTALDICKEIAKRKISEGFPQFASDLLFESLRHANALPLDLLTGSPVEDAAEITGLPYPAADPRLASYLIAVIDLHAARFDLAYDGVAQLCEHVDDTKIRAYLCSVAAQSAIGLKNFAVAGRWIKEARRLMPSSLTLFRLARETENGQQELELRTELQQQITTRLRAVESAKTADQGIEESSRLAALYAETGAVQQAVGVYVRTAVRYASDGRSDNLLRHAIHLLEGSDSPVSRVRLATIQKILAKQQSSRAGLSPASSSSGERH